MKKITALCFCTAILAVLTGCSSVQTTQRLNHMRSGTPPKEDLVQIHTQIDGVFLFGFIPLFSGSANTPGKTTMFMNTIRQDYAVLMATSAARQMGATTIENINTTFHSHSQFPWFFLTDKCVQVSLLASK